MKYNTGGTLSVTTTASEATTWTVGNNCIYYVLGPTHQCITYSSGWKIKQCYFEGQVITDGKGNYLKVTSSSSFTNTTSFDDATRFYNENRQIYTNFYNGATQENLYLKNNSGALSFTARDLINISTYNNWYIGTDFIYFSLNSNTYYLVYKDSSWKLDTASNIGLNSAKIGFRNFTESSFSDYLGVDSSNGSLKSSAVTKDNAAVWVFENFSNGVGTGKVYTLVNGTKYWLICKGHTISTSKNESDANSYGVWKAKDSKMCCSYNGTNYYIGKRLGSWYGRDVSSNGYYVTYDSVSSSYKSSISSGVMSDASVKYQITSSTSPTVSIEDYNKTLNVKATNTTGSTLSYVSSNLEVNANINNTEESILELSKYKKARDFTLTLTNTTYERVEKTVEENVKGGLASVIPLQVQTDENTGAYLAGYPASEKNTGYIVSGVNADSGITQQFYGDIRVSYESMSKISNSLGQDTYSANLLQVLTINGSGTHRIKDTYNQDSTTTAEAISSLDSKTIDDLGFSSYTEARDQLDALLKASGSNIYGLHFVDSSISMDKLTTTKQATVLGKTYTNYQLPEDSIDFNVICRGKISFFAGTYYTSLDGSEDNSFFSLHHIFRSASSNEITAIREISKIYMSIKSGTNKPYIYLYKDGTYSDADGGYSGSTSLPSGYTEIFDTVWITNTSTTSDAVYYFEIPCNAGEYALGSVPNKNGAYLFYLDIGSAGDDSDNEILSTDGNYVSTEYSVDFRDAPDTVVKNLLQLSYKIPDGSSNTNFSVKVEFDKDDVTNHSNGCYKIYVTNKTGLNILFSVLLLDDDDTYGNDYQYAYEIYVTNSDNTNTKIKSSSGKTYFQAIGSYNIPSSGTASEASYNTN